MLVTQLISQEFLSYLSKESPYAMAVVRGSSRYPNINGTVLFYQTNQGTFIMPSIQGLPYGEGVCNRSWVFGMHIHSGEFCRLVTEQDPFALAGSHYNPNSCLHPYHSGDLPPLFSYEGFAWYVVNTRRITVDEVIGKVVIIHSEPDDFKTQPHGAAGEKIACGVISPFKLTTDDNGDALINDIIQL